MKYIALILLSFTTVLCANDIDDIKTLRAPDVTAAIIQAEKLWRSSQQNQRIGEQLLLSYVSAKQYKKALVHASELLATEFSDKTLHARILSIQLQVIDKLKDWSTFEDILAKTLAFLAEMGKTENAIIILDSLGQIELSQVHFQKAEAYFLQAITISDKIKSPTLASLYRDYGISLAQQGKLSNSLDAMSTSYKIYESNNVPIPLTLLKAMGALFMYTEQYEKALEYTHKAIKTLKPDSKKLASLYSNVGAMQAALKHYPLAIQALKQSIALNKSHQVLNSSPLNNLGFAYSAIGQYDQALTVLFESYDIAQRKDSPIPKATSCKNIAEIYIKLENYHEAEKYFDKAYQHYSSHDSQVKKLELYEPMISNLEKLAKYEKALRLMKEYKELTDEIESAEAKEHLNNSLVAFELERKEKELLNSKLDVVLFEKSILKLEGEKSILKNIRLFYSFIIIITALVILVVLIAYRIKVKAYEKVEMLSRTDELTALLNRRAIYDILQNELLRLKRNEKSLCLLIIDIDLFKKVNDSFGHACGDMALKKVANLLSSSVRQQDSVARWGGEEFMVLLPETDKNGGKVIAEKLRLAVENLKISYQNKHLSVTISIGLQACDVGENVESYIKSADDALYKAKADGRNRVVVVNNVVL